MSALFRIVYATHATGTHHKLALDALREMRSGDKAAWMRLFLKHVERYLEGSKAPDVTFKDFKNHVLHVSEGYWGGAPEKAEEWYRKTVAELKSENWPEAVYAAGVLSHYYTDPVQPFHTGQSDAENAIHRAAEWSISRSYNRLRTLGEQKFADLDVTVPAGDRWLSELVCDGAEFSHRYYEKLIAHYDIHKGSVRPEDGFDDIGRGTVAELLVYAAKGFGRVLDAAVAEAGVVAPDVRLTAETFLAATKIPTKFIEKRLSNAEDRKLVTAIYDELKKTGRVEHALSEDDRTIRDLHQREVEEPKLAERRKIRAARLGIASSPSEQPQPEEPAVAQNASGDVPAAITVEPAIEVPAEEPPPDPPIAPDLSPEPSDLMPEPLNSISEPEEETLAASPPEDEPAAVLVPEAAVSEPPAPIRRYDPTRTATIIQEGKKYLFSSDTLEHAPSIGPKTAERFAAVGIHTVGDFLGHDPHDMAELLEDGQSDAETLADWQDQAQLVIDVPGLRGTHAQLLVGAGYRTAQEVADADPVALSANVLKFVSTSEGKRVLREGRPPDIEKIKGWVEVAKHAMAA